MQTHQHVTRSDLRRLDVSVRFPSSCCRVYLKNLQTIWPRFAYTRHGLPCTTIDPRHPKLSTQQLRQIGFRKAWRGMLEAAPTRSPLCRQLLLQWLQTPPHYVSALLRGYDDKGVILAWA